MQVLKRGHTELFRRGPDECFDSLAGLTRFCQEQKEKSVDRWVPPRSPRPLALDKLVIDFADPGAMQSEEAYQMNDWSFTQLCQLAKVSRDTVIQTTTRTMQTTTRRSACHPSDIGFATTLPGRNHISPAPLPTPDLACTHARRSSAGRTRRTRAGKFA